MASILEIARAREWIALLERDPEWTERMREELDKGHSMAGDLVLLLAPMKRYPLIEKLARSSERAVRVGEWLAVMATVDEVMRVQMPIDDRDALCAREPRDKAHGLALVGLRALSFRFRVPLG